MNITQECFDHNARISTIIHVGGAIVDEDTLSDSLDKFIEDDLWDLGYELFPVKDPFAATDDVDDMEVPYKIEAAEWLIHNRLFGFLVQVDTPVIKPENVRLNDEGDLSGYSYTWGYYRHRWLYANTFEVAATAGIEWTKGQADAAVEKARELAKEKNL